MSLSTRIGPLFVALVAACTIRVEQREGNGSAEAECLDLFETCVELAGESPGCTEVYQFCQGSVLETGTGGMVPTGGCEQDYVECLQGGSSPEACQPLLDICTPPDPTGVGTTGLCVFGDPDCDPTGSSTGEIDPDCEADDPDCNPAQVCEAIFLACVEQFAEESICLQLQASCQSGDCGSAFNLCVRAFGDESVCQEIINCDVGPPPASDCDAIRSGCGDEGLLVGQCSINHPGNPDCFPEVDGCTWYQEECQAQFREEVCFDAIDACVSGLFPETFDCDSVFAEGCSLADLSDVACSQAIDACNNGFVDVDLCAETRIYENPFVWLSQMAACNGWEG